MDMAAGIEHLSRGTARAVDELIIVVEPGRASIETAGRISTLARDLGIASVSVVGNKVRHQTEKDFIASSLPGFDILGFMPWDPALTLAEIRDTPRLQASAEIKASVNEILQKLLQKAASRVA